MLKKNPIIQISEPVINYEIPNRVEKLVVRPAERTLSKTIKAPFSRIQFLHASITFFLFIDELDREMTFEIANPYIRPEFEVIKDYFTRF